MTKIIDLLTVLENIAPLQYQESYDNAGLLIGDVRSTVTGVVTCLDSTEDVIDEAIRKNCNVVLAHHPIVFGGLKSFTGKSYVERVVIKAIKNDINIIAMHTNLDNVLINGVNEKIADRIGLSNIKILSPKEKYNNIVHTVGSGIVGELPEKMDSLNFLEHLKLSMELEVLKYTALVHKEIKNVAVCGGSGSFLLQDAIDTNADIFITGDYKYHDFFDADGKIIIADIGHYESEKYTIDLLHEIITRNFSNFAAYKTEVITNPIKYL